MRVAHILPWKSVGGVEIGTLRICKLTRHEVENVAFCVDGDSPVPDLFRSEGFEVVRFTPATPSLLRQFPAYLRESRRIAAQLRGATIDIVYCADLLAAYQAAFGGRLARLPVICHMR